jgi:hypothetical protein
MSTIKMPNKNLVEIFGYAPDDLTPSVRSLSILPTIIETAGTPIKTSPLQLNPFPPRNMA